MDIQFSREVPNVFVSSRHNCQFVKEISFCHHGLLSTQQIITKNKEENSYQLVLCVCTDVGVCMLGT